MPENIPPQLPHILVTGTARPTPYTSPSSGRKSFKFPPRQRENHGRSLLVKFQRLREEAERVSAEQRAFAIDAESGIYVQFESEPDYDLKFESLEARQSGIELLSVQQREHKTLATVFIPEGKLEIFTNKIEKYLKEETEKGIPKNQPLVESISDIRRAALEALWTDDSTELPDDDETIWWEVWLRAGDDPQKFLNFFREHALRLELEVSSKEIRFPDRTVVTARGTKAQMGRSVKLLSCVAELRRAKETAQIFLPGCGQMNRYSGLNMPRPTLCFRQVNLRWFAYWILA